MLLKVFFNKDIEMSWDMLYRHKKLVAHNHLKPSHPCYSHIAYFSLLDGFASTIQMYSRLCPWLLTWSDYEEGYKEGEGGYDDADAN
jgi:hypothetical protein